MRAGGGGGGDGRRNFWRRPKPPEPAGSQACPLAGARVVGGLHGRAEAGSAEDQGGATNLRRCTGC